MRDVDPSSGLLLQTPRHTPPYYAAHHRSEATKANRPRPTLTQRPPTNRLREHRDYRTDEASPLGRWNPSLVEAEAVEAISTGARRGPFVRTTTPNSAPYTTILCCASSERGDESKQTTSYSNTTPSNKPASRASRLPYGRGVSSGQVESFACRMTAYPIEL